MKNLRPTEILAQEAFVQTARDGLIYNDLDFENLTAEGLRNLFDGKCFQGVRRMGSRLFAAGYRDFSFYRGKFTDGFPSKVKGEWQWHEYCVLKNKGRIEAFSPGTLTDDFPIPWQPLVADTVEDMQHKIEEIVGGLWPVLKVYKAKKPFFQLRRFLGREPFVCVQREHMIIDPDTQESLFWPHPTFIPPSFDSVPAAISEKVIGIVKNS